jgi:hypothetical protein
METMTTFSQLDREVQQKCLEFAEILGLNEPVSSEVLQAATEDETYAHNLLVCRKEPAFLNYLLANPPKLRSSPELLPQDKTNLELISKASHTLLKWAQTGFSVVDDETLERRENACLACPHLSEPQKLVQKIIPSKEINQKIGQRTGKKVCNLCGCNVSKKIRIPSESCPDKHPTQAAMTRWGEPA